jgi:hypothetical protein
MHGPEVLVLFLLFTVVAPIIFVIRQYGQFAPNTGERVAWQQAHTAVKMTIRRHVVRMVVATSLALALHAYGPWELAIIVGIVATDAIIALGGARFAMARLERPLVRIERRGNWLFVEGPRWVHCTAKEWQRASALASASAGLRRDN